MGSFLEKSQIFTWCWKVKNALSTSPEHSVMRATKEKACSCIFVVLASLKFVEGVLQVNQRVWSFKVIVYTINWPWKQAGSTGVLIEGQYAHPVRPQGVHIVLPLVHLCCLSVSRAFGISLVVISKPPLWKTHNSSMK